MHKHRFIDKLSSDIVKENHHLKSDLISLRKKFAQHEQKIINELEIAAKTINFKTNFLNFDSADEALDQFVKLVHQSLNKVASYQTEYEGLITEHTSTRSLLEEKTREVSNKKNAIEILKGQKIKAELTQKELLKQLSQLHSKYKDDKEKANSEIIILNQRLKNLDQQLNLKYMLDKKQAMEKANSQLIEYRQKLELQFTNYEKQVRSQIQKKDNKLKEFLYTINSYLEDKLDQDHPENLVLEQQITRLKTESEPTKEQLIFLKSVMKPFADHDALHRKVSELREQLSESREQCRKMATLGVSLKIKNNEIKNELQIYISKYEIQSRKYKELSLEYELAVGQKQRLKKDLQAIENYYDKKWVHEFNSVKENLQKKFKQKEDKLELQYSEKQSILEGERVKMKSEVENIIKQMIKIQLHNKELSETLNSKTEELQSSMREIKKLMRTIKECELMGNEDRLSLSKEYQDKLSAQRSEIQSHKVAIKTLRNDLDETIQKYDHEIEELVKTHVKSYDEAVYELEQEKANLEKEKDKQIRKLNRTIGQHKNAIQQIHQEMASKIQETKAIMKTQQDQVIKELAKVHHEEINMYQERIIKYNYEVTETKNKIIQEKEDYVEEAARYERTIKQKEYAIKQIQRSLSQETKDKQETIKILEMKERDNRELIENKQSLQRFVNALQVQIQNLNEELKDFLAQKKIWKKQLTSIKKDYDHGFKELKEIFDKRLSYYKSRIWELEMISTPGVINQREIEKIRSLTEEKGRLQNLVKKKEAQNLILTEVKKYYEKKSEYSESKISLNNQLREQKQSILVKKPNQRNQKCRIKQIKTQVSYDHNSSINDSLNLASLNRGAKTSKCEDKSLITKSYRQNLVDSPKYAREPKNVQKEEEFQTRKKNRVLNPAVIKDYQIFEKASAKHQRVSSCLL